MNVYKGNFSTRTGALLAAAGSAVGLGNIWRFPTETGTHGGAAFLVIYIFFMIVLGVPIMITELAIGRHGGRNVSHSFYVMSGGVRAWGYIGIVPVVAGVLVLSYYSVVAGWTLDYFVSALSNQFAGKSPEAYAAYFTDFSSNTWRPVAYLAATVFLTAAIVAFGVRKGIERASKIMMPMLFVCLVLLVCGSLTLPGMRTGLAFYFRPDFSQVTGGTILSAMGQAFFSLSLGVYCICTYGCYFRKDGNLVRESLSVAGIDTLVALLAGLMIFPAVFSVEGLQPAAGPGLVFITLPNVFRHVFSFSPLLSYMFSLLFYFLLVLAALTSMISMLETSASIFIRKYKIPRPVACFGIALVCTALGATCSLSFGAWQDIKPFGLSIFEMFDFAVAKLIMPVCSLVSCLFAGWVVDRKILRDEITNGGALRQPLYPVYHIIIRYVAPVGIALIFINELGWL